MHIDLPCVHSSVRQDRASGSQGLQEPRAALLVLFCPTPGPLPLHRTGG